MSDVKASYLIENFKLMVAQHWKYVANSAVAKAVDCSGSFTYWYKKAGSYMYHGSNTMWRKYSLKKGAIGSIELVPGMAVYKKRDDGKEPSAYKKDGLGNFYHVGLYIGDGLVVEARGTKSGVVTSKLSDWGYCSQLKNTIYDVAEKKTEPEPAAAPVILKSDFPCKGVVNTIKGSLRLRKSASATAPVIANMSKGASVNVLEKTSALWYKVEWENNVGYASVSYIKI